MTRSIVFPLCIALGVASIARADEKGPQAPNDQAKAMADMQQKLLKAFDADGDGMLNPMEMAAMQRYMAGNGGPGIGPPVSAMPNGEELKKRFDRDGDGRLSPAEAGAMQAAMQKMFGNGRGNFRGGGGSSLQPPAVTPQLPAEKEGKGSKLSALAKRFDKDGDGKLSDEEKKTAQEELKKSKSKDKDAKAKEKPAAKKS